MISQTRGDVSYYTYFNDNEHNTISRSVVLNSKRGVKIDVSYVAHTTEKCIYKKSRLVYKSVYNSKTKLYYEISDARYINHFTVRSTENPEV
jgi:hypothetical protein